MLCPTGQVQIAVNNDGTPFCVDASVAAALNQGSNIPQGTIPNNGIPATGGIAATGTGGGWLQNILSNVPGILTGTASIISAGKGIEPPDNIYVMQAPPTPEKEDNKSKIWLILLGVILAIGAIIFFATRHKKA